VQQPRGRRAETGHAQPRPDAGRRAGEQRNARTGKADEEDGRANLTTGAVSGVLNRLERAGYARRRVDPADRRRVRIVPEEAAAAVAAYEPNYHLMATLFADYTPDEIAVLHDWLTRAAAVARGSLEAIRQGGTP
jgi:DNA-binding MarR family transcriptional regulator